MIYYYLGGKKQDFPNCVVHTERFQKQHDKDGQSIEISHTDDKSLMHTHSLMVFCWVTVCPWVGVCLWIRLVKRHWFWCYRLLVVVVVQRERGQPSATHFIGVWPQSNLTQNLQYRPAKGSGEREQLLHACF